MKNRILSVFCAIAMLATMMSTFVVTASAADAPAVTLTVLKQATDTEPAEVELGYTGIPDGVKVKGIQIEIPVDTTKFTYVDGSATGSIKYDAGTNTLKRVWTAMEEEQYKAEAEAKIGKFQLALADGVAPGQIYELATSVAKFALTSGNVVLENVKVELSTGEAPKPTVPPEPTLPETAYVYTKVLNQPEKAGDEVEIEVSYANITEGDKIKGIQIEIPLGDKLTYVEGSATGSMKYDAGTNKIKRVWTAMEEDQYKTETAAVVGVFKVKVADTAVIGDTISVVADTAKFALVSGNKSIETVAGTIVVGSGAVQGLTVTADKTALTLEPGASDVVTLTIANAEGTPTVTAKSDNTDVTATVSGEKVTVKAGSKAKDGTAKVTVTVKDADGCEATVEITVTVKAKAEDKPAVKGEVKTEVKEVAGGVKQTFFTAEFKLAAGVTAEVLDTIIKDNETYQVQFDATKGSESVGYAIINGLAGADVKNALLNGTPITNVSVCIGGANAGKVALLGADGSTIKLPE